MITVDEAREALLERIRRETREAVEEGDRQDCSSPDCIADAVYEIARVSVDALIATVRAEARADFDTLGKENINYLTGLHDGRAESAETLRALREAAAAVRAETLHNLGPFGPEQRYLDGLAQGRHESDERLRALRDAAERREPLDVERLHAANIGCTWDESIPKRKMCDPSWHEDDAAEYDRLEAAE